MQEIKSIENYTFKNIKNDLYVLRNLLIAFNIKEKFAKKILKTELESYRSGCFLSRYHLFKIL